MNRRLKLGRKPFVEDPRDLHLVDYVDLSTIHLPDSVSTGPFDHTTWIGGREWQVLGNDEWGDCALAAPAHEIMALTGTSTGTPAPFTTAGILRGYAALGGFNPSAGPPGENSTDQGLEVRAVYKYRRRHGIPDAIGGRHRVGFYMRVDWRNQALAEVAKRLFGAINYGFNLPESAPEQFDRGEPWSVVAGSPIVGGHDVTDLAEPHKMISWGSAEQVEEAFVQQYAEEAWCSTSPDLLNDHGLSPEGLDVEKLAADYAALSRQ